MSSYLYGMHDQIVKGYAPLRVTKGGPHFVDSQGLNPEGLGGEGASSMSEDVNPVSRPSFVTDTATLEGPGTYGGKLKEMRPDVLGDPRRVAEAGVQAFSAGVRNRFHKLTAKPRLTRHPLNANVRQLDTAAERYIAAPQYEDPVTRVTNEEMKAIVTHRSDTVIETPEPSASEPVHIGLLVNKAEALSQADAVRAANAVTLRAMNVARYASKLASRPEFGGIGATKSTSKLAETVERIQQKPALYGEGAADPKAQDRKIMWVGLGALAVLGVLAWATSKVA